MFAPTQGKEKAAWIFDRGLEVRTSGGGLNHDSEIENQKSLRASAPLR
jgi:hypothetical protein